MINVQFKNEINEQYQQMPQNALYILGNSISFLICIKYHVVGLL